MSRPMSRSHRSLLARAAVLSALLLGAAGGAQAQTWARDVVSGVPSNWSSAGLAVSDAGQIAVIHSDASTAGVTLLDAQGVITQAYDQVTFGGEDLRWSDGLYLADGTLVVCGKADGRAFVAGIDPQLGTSLWDYTITALGTWSDIRHLTVNQLGHVVAFGSHAEALGDTELFACAIDPAEGLLLWRRTYGEGFATSIRSLADGDLLLSSYEDSVLRLTRTSAWGHIVWSREYSSLSHDLFRPHVEQTPDGGLLVGGLCRDQADQYELMALRLDGDGELQWGRRYLTFPATTFGSFLDVGGMALAPGGGCTLAVRQPMPGGGEGDDDLAVLRLDAAGDPVWYRSYGKTGWPEHVTDLAPTPDGGVLAMSLPADSDRARVVRLDAQGDASACPNAPLSIFPSSLAVVGVDVPLAYEVVSGLMTEVHAMPVPAWRTTSGQCGSWCAVTGGAYGGGTAGTGGLVPKLVAEDGWCLGWTPSLRIEHVVGGAPGLLCFGFAPAAVPAMGGTFLIDPSLLITIPFGLGGSPGFPGAGEAEISLGSDLTWAEGLTLHVQAVFGDPNGPTGKTLTNAVTLAVQ